MRVLQKPREIGKIAFLNWVEKDNFWFEEAPILPITVETLQRNMVMVHELFSPGLEFSVFVYEKDFALQVLSLPESIATSKTHFDELSSNPKKIKWFLEQWQLTIKNLENALAVIDLITLEKLSKKELLKHFEETNKAFYEFGFVSIAIEPCKPFFDTSFYAEFEKLVGNPKEAKEFFSILTMPLKHSFIIEEKKDLLRMAIAYIPSKEKESFLERSNKVVLEELQKNNPKFFQELQRHQKKYYWMQNNYFERTVLSLEDFIEVMKNTIKNVPIEELKAELEKISNFQPLIFKQKSILEKLNISEKLGREIGYVQELSWLMDERKRMILMYLDKMFFFLSEFSRRTGINEKLLGYALIDEIPAILNQKFSENVLKERRKLCVLVTQKGNKQSVLVGKEAKEIKPFLIKKTDKASSAILGTVACRGPEVVVVGKAKIILFSKSASISEDEILITTMTRPDFVQLMKTAKAIVTNEGGITCHAAIVSRELNKPCIIATKYATDFLKTGDEIEMRMNHGVVKILKRAD